MLSSGHTTTVVAMLAIRWCIPKDMCMEVLSVNVSLCNQHPAYVSLYTWTHVFNLEHKMLKHKHGLVFIIANVLSIRNTDERYRCPGFWFFIHATWTNLRSNLVSYGTLAALHACFTWLPLPFPQAWDSYKNT